jgi:hypothetical protein
MVMVTHHSVAFASGHEGAGRVVFETWLLDVPTLPLPVGSL